MFADRLNNRNNRLTKKVSTMMLRDSFSFAGGTKGFCKSHITVLALDVAFTVYPIHQTLFALACTENQFQTLLHPLPYPFVVL